MASLSFSNYKMLYTFCSCLCLLAIVANGDANTRLLLQGEKNTLFQKLCAYTSERNFCQSILESNPGSSKADAKGLIRIIVKAATENATESAYYIFKHFPNTKPVELNRSLADCYDEYQLALFRLKDVPGQIDASNYDDAQSYLTAPIEVNSGCRVSFIHFPYPPELAKRGSALQRISTVARSIILHFFIGYPNGYH